MGGGGGGSKSGGGVGGGKESGDYPGQVTGSVKLWPNRAAAEVTH